MQLAVFDISKPNLKFQINLRADLRDNFEATSTHWYLFPTVVSRQSDCLVDAPRAENFSATEAVRLLHFLWERRRTGTNCGTAETLPIQRYWADFIGDLVDFRAVCFRHGQVGERIFSSFERVIVIGGLKLTKLLVVVVELVVGEVFTCCILQETRAVCLQLSSRLWDEIFDISDALWTFKLLELQFWNI